MESAGCVARQCLQGGRLKNYDWFERRRHFFMRQVYDDFFGIMRAFQDVYWMFLDCRESGSSVEFDLLVPDNENIRNRIWDKLTVMVGTELEKGPLWQLKDLCHRMWPEGASSTTFEGTLVDWFIGSIFHEAMKLKENIYILCSYGPAALKKRETEGIAGGDLQQLARVLDVTELIGRVGADVAGQLDQLAFLFGKTSYILRTMLPGLSGNLLVVRLIAEQEAVVETLWGEDAVALFADMFQGVSEKGFCAAGKSYLAGQWNEQAQIMYQRALHINADCDEAARQLKSFCRKK
jgi:hypothetical protein